MQFCCFAAFFASASLCLPAPASLSAATCCRSLLPFLAASAASFAAATVRSLPACLLRSCSLLACSLLPLFFRSASLLLPAPAFALLLCRSCLLLLQTTYKQKKINKLKKVQINLLCSAPLLESGKKESFFFSVPKAESLQDAAVNLPLPLLLCFRLLQQY